MNRFWTLKPSYLGTWTLRVTGHYIIYQVSIDLFLNYALFF